MPRTDRGRRRRIGPILAAVVLLLAALCLAVRLGFPAQGPLTPTGPYTAGSWLVTYTDLTRHEPYSRTHGPRQVHVQFWYPIDAPGVQPLVVFSHGGLGIMSSNESLYRELASHGYVVASIGHPYHALWARGADGRTTLVSWDYARELLAENARHDPHQSLAYYRGWMQVRMDDIDLVIDTVREKADAGAEGVYRLVDSQRIGVMGHSLGGSAALGIGRRRTDVAAVVALEAPYMYDIVAVAGDAFSFTEAPYVTPVLHVYSDSAWHNLRAWPQYARNAALATREPSHMRSVHITGVGHLALTDLALTSPLLVRLLDNPPPSRDPADALRMVSRLTLSFLDSCLKSWGALPASGTY